MCGGSFGEMLQKQGRVKLGFVDEIGQFREEKSSKGAQMRGGTHSGMGKRVEWEGLLIRIFAGGGTKKGRGAVASALGCGCWVERVRTRHCSASVGRGLRHVYSPFR